MRPVHTDSEKRRESYPQGVSGGYAKSVTIGDMSEDWLVTSGRPLAVEDIIMSLRVWGEEVSVRVDTDELCTVVVDRADRVLVWFGPSQHVSNPHDALLRNGLAAINDAEREARWWTEIIQPATRHTGLSSRVDAGSVATALAQVAHGHAQRLSAAEGETGRDKASESSGDIACDVMTGTCAIFLQTRPVLAVTPWASMAMAWAARRGLKPVFLTPGTTQLSPVMHHFARRGGCLWVRQGPEGMHNGASGAGLAWSDGTFVESSAAPWPVALSGEWEVVYEGEALHTDTAGMQIGRLAQMTHDACGMEDPTSWGVLEPTSDGWALGDITEHARDASPKPSRVFFRSPNSDGIVTVLPQPVGVQESVAWAAPADDLMPRSTNLRRLGERLLEAGSDVSLLGYRRPTIAASGRGGATGNVLPGVICFKPGRFGGLSAATLDLPADSGAFACAVDAGVVVTFGVQQDRSDAASVRLLAAWEHTLSTLTRRNSVYSAYRDDAESTRDAAHIGARA